VHLGASILSFFNREADRGGFRSAQSHVFNHPMAAERAIDGYAGFLSRKGDFLLSETVRDDGNGTGALAHSDRKIKPGGWEKKERRGIKGMKMG